LARRRLSPEGQRDRREERERSHESKDNGTYLRGGARHGNRGVERIGGQKEYGIGHTVGHATDAPVMILKSCIGNRSLGWDLLPPGSERYEVEEKDRKTGQAKTFVYAGYKDSPARWEKGTEPKKIGWYAGMQYDGDVANAKRVLAQLDKYYPGAKTYEVAGFFFWQGDKDRYNAAHASRYEQNLVHFIKQLRKDFNAPKAKFVCATLGQTRKAPRATRERYSRPNSRWTARAASTLSSRATWPRSTPIPSAMAAPPTATTAATRKRTWMSAKPWAGQWSP
jgi:hypothetical protein